jgi:hypothetical protein
MLYLILFLISQNSISKLQFEANNDVLTNADDVNGVNTQKNELNENLHPIYKFCVCHSVFYVYL